MANLYNLKQGVGLDWVESRLAYTAFTKVEGTATKATASLGATIPVGAHVLGAQVVVHTGYTGDTSAVMTLGDGSDADRYNTSTIDVASSGYVSAGAPSGTLGHAAAVTPTVTLTTGADYDNVSAGDMTVRITFLPAI